MNSKEFSLNHWIRVPGHIKVTDQIITPQIIQQANYGQIRTNQGNNNYGMTKTSTNNYLITTTHQQKSNLHQDLISNWYVHQGW